MKTINSVKRSSLIFSILFVLLTGLSAQGVYGQVTIASDDESQTTYNDGWGNGENGGSGFGAWSLSSSSGGHYVGVTGLPDGDTFGLYGNSGGYAYAERPFSSPMTAGDTFSVDLGHTGIIFSGATLEVVLKDGSTTKFVLKFTGGGSNWEINDGGSDFNAGQVYSHSTKLTFSITLEGENKYSYTFGSGSGTNYTFSSTVTQFTSVEFKNNGQGSGENFGFDNLRVVREGKINGTEGWRLLASPVTGSTYNDLIGGLWTQCFTGADYNTSVSGGGYCADDGSESNVRTLNSSGSYVSISSQSDALTAGEGFAMYVYSDDDFDGTAEGFPKTISVSGTESTSDVSPTTFSADDTYTLLGNPFISTIDFDNLTRSDLSSVVYVYDHSYTSGFTGDDELNTGGAGGGWRTWNGSAGGLTGGLIAPFQGFLVVSTDASSTITIPTTAKSSSSASLLDETTSPPSIQLAARINESQVSDVWFSFTETGSLEENSYDANALYALDYTPYLMFHTVSNGRALDIKNLPVDLEGELSLPLKINGWKPVDDEDVLAYEPMGGSVEIIWPTMRNIPDEWDVRLTDHEAGTSVDLTDPTVERYEFDLVVDAKSSERLPYRLAVQEAKVPEKLNTRFTLDITAVPTSINPADELPTQIALAQNYPNPFNPTTSISFELPQSQSMNLNVFDLSGRHVATIASGMHHAGSHTVNFDASGLSSGVYFYRLQTENATLTRKFTLLK